jgi:hypothetical protein
MRCPRLDHFVGLNQGGSVGKCGHMVDAKGFKTFEELEHSEWLKSARDTMSQDTGQVARGMYNGGRLR